MSHDFGKYIVQLRLSAGYPSQAELSRAAGVSNSTIARIESGKTTNPDPATLHQLAPFLKVPYQELFVKCGYLPETELTKEIYQEGKKQEIVREFEKLKKMIKDFIEVIG
jgi:transcriptional regulator with XRE-family HTH domain